VLAAKTDELLQKYVEKFLQNLVITVRFKQLAESFDVVQSKEHVQFLTNFVSITFHHELLMFPHDIWNAKFFRIFPPHLHLTTSKVMVIVWRLRGNIIRTVLYIANVHCEQKAMRDEGVIYVASHPLLNRCTRLPGCFYFPKRKL